VKAYEAELAGDGYKVEPAQPKKIEGNDAKLITFSGLRATDAKVKTSRLVMVKDSMMVHAQYAHFNDMFDPYKTVMDSLFASLTLPKPKSAAEAANPALPSSEFDTFDNFAVKLQHPSNFEASTPRPKGDIQFAVDLKGYRQDCSVHLDIRPAKGLSVDKVFDQNIKFFQPISKGETTVDGLKAPFVNFRPPVKGIFGRAYFIVKSDKMVRVIFSINESMKADFLPAFEKIVSSIKIK
jgi:hypothetical protein